MSYDSWKLATPPEYSEATPHADGGSCYVLGRTEVRKGVAPMCDEPGCGKTIDDYWVPREFGVQYADEDRIRIRADEDHMSERDYDPDEDRTP